MDSAVIYVELSTDAEEIIGPYFAEFKEYLEKFIWNYGCRVEIMFNEKNSDIDIDSSDELSI